MIATTSTMAVARTLATRAPGRLARVLQSAEVVVGRKVLVACAGRQLVRRDVVTDTVPRRLVTRYTWELPPCK